MLSLLLMSECIEDGQWFSSITQTLLFLSLRHWSAWNDNRSNVKTWITEKKSNYFSNLALYNQTIHTQALHMASRISQTWCPFHNRYSVLNIVSSWQIWSHTWMATDLGRNNLVTGYWSGFSACFRHAQKDHGLYFCVLTCSSLGALLHIRCIPCSSIHAGFDADLCMLSGGSPVMILF